MWGVNLRAEERPSCNQARVTTVRGRATLRERHDAGLYRGSFAPSEVGFAPTPAEDSCLGERGCAGLGVTGAGSIVGLVGPVLSLLARRGIDG
jgi:hypothetical protein